MHPPDLIANVISGSLLDCSHHIISLFRQEQVLMEKERGGVVEDHMMSHVTHSDYM